MNITMAKEAIWEGRQGGPGGTSRGVWQFGLMLWCGTGCNPFRYDGYGCWCGLGGGGAVVDDIDR